MSKPPAAPMPPPPAAAPPMTDTPTPPSTSPPLEMPLTPMPPPLEGFASGGNPYSAPSPNLSQSFEFRLGKRELVDAVMQVAR